MAKRKALVIYGSITGNTQMVAKEFGKVCEENGFEVDLVKIDPRRNWDKDPVFVEDYDLVCLGSPIIAGLPYKEVSMLMGLQGKKQLYRNRDVYERIQAHLAAGGHLGPGAGEVHVPGQIPGVHYNTGIPGITCMDVGTGAPGSKSDVNKKTIYGVVFCTYGGSGVGPEECYGTLEVMVEYLRVNGIRCVGKFACPGKELRHSAVDRLAMVLKVNIDEAQAMMQRYKENPQSEEFGKLNPGQLKALAEGANTRDEDSFGDDAPTMMDNDPMGCGKRGSIIWHYDFQNRPSPRDLTKANIFLNEVVEDYFMTFTGDPRPPYSVYTCIS